MPQCHAIIIDNCHEIKIVSERKLHQEKQLLEISLDNNFLSEKFWVKIEIEKNPEMQESYRIRLDQKTIVVMRIRLDQKKIVIMPPRIFF